MIFRLVMTTWLFTMSTQMRADQEELHPLQSKPLAAAFELKDSNGKIHRLSDYRGKVVVLNFWATWCPPCRQEMPSMERAQKALADQDVVFLAVDVGEDEDTLFTFTADYPVSFPLLMDTTSEVIKSYPVVGLPTTFVLDGEGRIRYRAVGSRNWDKPDMLRSLSKLRGSDASPAK